MLTIAKTKKSPKTWPELPYKGLSYYEPDDAPLFAGRAKDVVECADLLAREETRILILHGSTGCGKSSFLRAGLIPFLEHDDLGFGFLKHEESGKLTSIFVRATGKPLVELAKKVCDFAKADITLKKSNKQEYFSLNFPMIIAEFGGEVEFVEKISSEPELFIKVLGQIAAKLTKTLVLIVDQGEEVITLKPNRDDELPLQTFFRFVELFSTTHFDLKLLIALRTEFYGRFMGKMPQGPFASTIAQYLLDDLTKEQIVSAIERPTSIDYVEGFGVPFEHYGFKYEKGLPDKIASDLLSKKLAGGILPVMQIVCDTLYQIVKPRPGESAGTDHPREITEASYRALGSIEDQIDRSLNTTFAQWCRQNDITSDSEIQKETERWKDTLSNLAGSQSDGTVTTDVVTAGKLKEWATESKCKLNLEQTIAHLVSPGVRILRDAEFFDARSERIVRYSLGHDAIGLALYRWKVTRSEVAGAIGDVRSKLRVLGSSVTILGLVTWLIVRIFLESSKTVEVVLLSTTVYGLFFILLSYASNVPGLDRLFYMFLISFPQLIPKRKLSQLMMDKHFIELARRNPLFLERLQRMVEEYKAENKD